MTDPITQAISRAAENHASITWKKFRPSETTAVHEVSPHWKDSKDDYISGAELGRKIGRLEGMIEGIRMGEIEHDDLKKELAELLEEVGK